MKRDTCPLQMTQQLPSCDRDYTSQSSPQKTAHLYTNPTSGNPLEPSGNDRGLTDWKFVNLYQCRPKEINLKKIK